MATQAGLRATQAGLRATQAGFRGGDGRMDGRMGKLMDGWTDGWKICPFYRTLSPIGAAAQKGKDRERPTDTDRDPARLTKTDKEKLVTKLMILFF